MLFLHNFTYKKCKLIYKFTFIIYNNTRGGIMDMNQSYNYNRQGVVEEIKQYKRINKRNDVIIVVLSLILVFSFCMMIYVRFFA